MTHDIRPRWRRSYAASKLGTFTITAAALLIALFAPQGVFALVLIAWSAMGASLGPLVFLRAFDVPVSGRCAVAMIAVSIAVVSLWHVSGWTDDMYEIFPGMVASFATYGVCRLAAR